MRACATLLAVLATSGCGGPLDVVTELVDLRVLGIQAEPPELLVEGPATMPMSFTALVVDPRGGAVDYHWSFCPVDSANACLDYEAKRAAAAPGYRAGLDAMRGLSLEGTAQPLPEVEPQLADAWWSTRGLWRHTVGDFAVTAPPELFLYHLETSFLGLGMGSWPSAILDLSKNGATAGKDAITAEKRVVIGLAKRRAAAAGLAAQYGFTICPEGQTPTEVPGCLDLRDPVANTNPVFERIQVSSGGSRRRAVWRDVDVGDPGDVVGLVEVPAGHTIRILPSFTAASAEPYQVVKADFVNGSLFVEDRVEELSVSWFASAGALDDELTWPKFSLALDTAWTAPARPPSRTDGRVTIYMVARDQRGGESWRSLEVQVVP